MHAGSGLFALLTLTLFFDAAGARAAEIDWQAPAGCPDGSEVRFGVERAIRMPLGAAAPLRFAVRAERSARGYGARVAIEEQPGTVHGVRELDARDCPRLADMVIVTIALALGVAGEDGEKSAPTPAVTTAPVPAPAHAPGATDADQADAATSASAEEPWRPVLSAWLIGDSGSLPDMAAGAALAAQLDRGWLGLRVLGTLLFEQQSSPGTVEQPAPAARLGLVAGALSACASPFGAVQSTLSASGCAGWELGRMSGEGSGVLEVRTGSALWSAPRIDLEASLAFAVPGLRLGAMLSGAVPLVRDDFVLREFGTVHRPSAIIGRAGIGLLWAP